MNKRNLRLENYGISAKRYKELCGFCEQYPEWKSQLHHLTDTLCGAKFSDMPHSGNRTSDPTSELAIKRAVLSEKCDLIEKTAEDVDPYLAKYLIQSVCYEASLTYLHTYAEMPCSRSAFYDARRYFFYLLDKRKM